MPFETTLTKIFELGLNTFNDAEYEKLSELIEPYAELISPEIDLPKIKAPAVHLKGFEAIIAYWTETNKQYENRITKYTYTQLGKTSLVRSYYEHLDLVLDIEITFNEYAKITKMINSHVTV